MPKAILPTFSEGVTQIDKLLHYGCENGRIRYLYGSATVFTHAKCDLEAFRLIVSQFYVNGIASQVRLVAAFGINPLALKRWVKQYREFGSRSFFEGKPRSPRTLKKKE
jgi:Helix-turn-helix domain